MGIRITHKGNFKNTERLLDGIKEQKYMKVLEAAGQKGVDALSAATPVDSGTTANSWQYEIERGSDTTTIAWSNTNKNRGVNIAIILDKGHGTRNGGYVRGREYINPAIQPVFDEIADDIWKEVKGL